MSSKAILQITDCISAINLLSTDDGFLVCEWIPAVAQMKDGGVWQSSPLVDGKRLASRNFDNTIETFILTIKGSSQDAVITYIQSLTTMLEKGVAYWTTAWQKQPVWIEARGATETNARYAVIKGYKIEELANPYSQPFYGGCKSVIKEFVVVIERDHWLDQIPGTAHRIQLNNLQIAPTSGVGTVSAECTQPADSIQVSVGSTTATVGIGINYGRFGVEYSGGEYFYHHSGIRFPSIAIPKGTTIDNARLILRVAPDAGMEEYYQLNIEITAERTPNAAIFSGNYYDHVPRMNNSTNARYLLSSPQFSWSNPGEIINLVGLNSLIQEIIDLDGWVSGNAIVLYLNGFSLQPNVNNYRDYSTLTGSASPELVITYHIPSIEIDYGHEDTDTGNVYITNKHVQAQFTHIYYNQPAGAGFSANLIGTALPWTLLPNPPAVGDEIYFGISNDVSSYGPPSSLALDLIGASGITLDWAHSNSVGGWTSDITYTDRNTEDALNLCVDGEMAMLLSLGSPGAMTINSVPAYWIRATVSAISGVPTPPIQQNRPVYAIIMPFVDFDSSNIKGEIPAISRIRIESMPVFSDWCSDIIIGLRSKSRGINFSAYLNFSDVQIPAGVHTGGTFMDDENSPTGRCAYHTDSIERDDWSDTGASIYIDNTLSGQYQGSFHAYLRVRQYEGLYGDFNIRLKYSINVYESGTYSPSVVVPLSSWGSGLHIIDCGIINLGTMSLIHDDNLGTIYFNIEALHNRDGNTTIEFIDLILMPCDEWFGAFKCPQKSFSSNVLTRGRILDVDATGNPRTARALLRNPPNSDTDELNENFITEYIKMTRGGPFMQVNSDQRLWFTVFSDSPTSYSDSVLSTVADMVFGIRAYVVNRYLTMRGSI